ncbi:hypothetical protein [Faecalibaculum rodentium]|uniref:hypothetical protein n=1 Tax=Faecalibaculum rodentium TaxID=1702221 RepID=UPI0023F4DBAF|nr:hypothetical protein [Faecalibaculum rodentium]
MLVAAGIISRAALSVYISNCRLLTRNEKQHPGSAPVFAEKTGSSADAEICRFYGGLSDYQFGKLDRLRSSVKLSCNQLFLDVFKVVDHTLPGLVSTAD